MAAKASTQSRMPIQTIHDDVVITKDGNASVILETSAVNFGLLSENEQLAIIAAFAGLLNSLSYVIQIVIRSKRLDISKYLEKLDEARKKQTNPLLSQMMERYREFIKTTVRDNQVLDKKFYIVVSVSYLEVGISHNIEDNFEKALTLLLPRRDHIMRQIARIGLQTVQLQTEELIRLYYDIYNESGVPETVQALGSETKKQTPIQTETPKIEIVPAPELQKSDTSNPPFPHLTFNEPSTEQTQVPIIQSEHHSSIFSEPKPNDAVSSNYTRNTPFFVEELPDEYGTI